MGKEGGLYGLGLSIMTVWRGIPFYSSIYGDRGEIVTYRCLILGNKQICQILEYVNLICLLL